MRRDLLNQTTVPVAYAALMLDFGEEHGLARADLLQDLMISPAQLENPDGRITLAQSRFLLSRILQLTNDAALGYEIGLRSSVTSHGFVGLGLLSQPRMRDALEFTARFMETRMPSISLRLDLQNDWMTLLVSETTPRSPVSECVLSVCLTGLWQVISDIDPSLDRDGVDIWFDFPEPPHHARYATRLPPVRFQMPDNRLRVRRALLDIPLKYRNPTSAELASRRCENERSYLGLTSDFVATVRAQIIANESGLPDLMTLAKRLHMSPRTLKRRLQQHDTRFQSLLDEARCCQAVRLLRETALSVETIAERVGYTDRANFTRAFRRWTGQTPSAYRPET